VARYSLDNVTAFVVEVHRRVTDSSSSSARDVELEHLLNGFSSWHGVPERDILYSAASSESGAEKVCLWRWREGSAWSASRLIGRCLMDKGGMDGLEKLSLSSGSLEQCIRFSSLGTGIQNRLRRHGA
jgi:hypothetical protein